MAKIAFIGAGSFGFTRGLVMDLLQFPAFQDLEIALMDIDQERLDVIKRACDIINEKGGHRAKIWTTKDRREALEGADGVLCTILQGGVDVFRNDIEIPKTYGVDINVGDTRGPAGIFRAIRTLPVMLDICRDISELCPRAIFLNYTNPMAMLCSGMQKVYPELKISGLCHSVQGTAMMLADWIGADYKDITYTCAGINHQAFYLDFTWNGEDAYPKISEAIFGTGQHYNDEIVRNELYKHLDYYVTESSGHNSEYNAWFRKRPDLIEKYCTHGKNWNPGAYAYILNEYLEREDTWRDTIEEELVKLQQGVEKQAEDGEEFAGLDIQEYASHIFNAVFGDRKPFVFNGNVPNNCLIDNLPEGCCVEVPVVASPKGLNPVKVGSLPDHLAILVNTSARCEELALQGMLEKDRHKIFQAIAFDPLTSAVLSLEEIQNMVDEMFIANSEYCEDYA